MQEDLSLFFLESTRDWCISLIFTKPVSGRGMPLWLLVLYGDVDLPFLFDVVGHCLFLFWMPPFFEEPSSWGLGPTLQLCLASMCLRLVVQHEAHTFSWSSEGSLALTGKDKANSHDDYSLSNTNLYSTSTHFAQNKIPLVTSHPQSRGKYPLSPGEDFHYAFKHKLFPVTIAGVRDITTGLSLFLGHILVGVEPSADCTPKHPLATRVFSGKELWPQWRVVSMLFQSTSRGINPYSSLWKHVQHSKHLWHEGRWHDLYFKADLSGRATPPIRCETHLASNCKSSRLYLGVTFTLIPPQGTTN